MSRYFIKVKDQLLPVVSALSACRAAQAAGEEITDVVAKTIASLWQGPGYPGSVLAGFASGVAVDLEMLQEDLSQTIQEHYKDASKSDKLGLDMLGTYLIAKSNEYIAMGGRCPACKRQHSQHATSGEMTCMIHGNPAGSDFERGIWNKRNVSASELETRSRILGNMEAQRDSAHAASHKNEKGF